MTYDELQKAIFEVKDRAPGKNFGVNLRADQPDIADRLAAARHRGRARSRRSPRRRSKDVISRLKDAGIVTMPTIGAKRHAEKVAEWGVDAVIAQGAEGGGHTGTVPTSLLLPAGGRRPSTSR